MMFANTRRTALPWLHSPILGDAGYMTTGGHCVNLRLVGLKKNCVGPLVPEDVTVGGSLTRPAPRLVARNPVLDERIVVLLMYFIHID